MWKISKHELNNRWKNMSMWWNDCAHKSFHFDIVNANRQLVSACFAGVSTGKPVDSSKCYCLWKSIMKPLHLFTSKLQIKCARSINYPQHFDKMSIVSVSDDQISYKRSTFYMHFEHTMRSIGVRRLYVVAVLLWFASQYTLYNSIYNNARTRGQREIAQHLWIQYENEQTSIHIVRLHMYGRVIGGACAWWTLYMDCSRINCVHCNNTLFMYVLRFSSSP